MNPDLTRKVAAMPIDEFLGATAVAIAQRLSMAPQAEQHLALLTLRDGSFAYLVASATHCNCPDCAERRAAGAN